MKRRIYSLIIVIGVFTFTACEDFLVRAPLDTPSLETFWESTEQAEMWVNNLYNTLNGADDAVFEGYSDNAFGRSRGDGIANGSFQPNNSAISDQWDYRSIRL